MKKLLYVVMVAATMIGVELPITHATAKHSPYVAVGKKIRASVTGAGKSKFAAVNNAKKAARKVSRGSYRTIQRNTTGSGSSWICVMIIEYKQK